MASFGIRVVDDQGMGAGPISASGPIIRDRPVLWYDIDLAGSQAMAASDHLDFEPPAGMVGRLLTPDLIVKDLQAGFAYRDRRLVELLAP